MTGSALNISTLETEGIAPVTTAYAIGVTSLVSSIALFGAGLAATAGHHLPAGYLAAAGLALVPVAGVLAVTFLMGAHPRAGGAGGAGDGPAGAARAQEHRPGRGRRSRGRLGVADPVRANRAGILAQLRAGRRRAVLRPALAGP